MSGSIDPLASSDLSHLSVWMDLIWSVGIIDLVDLLDLIDSIDAIDSIDLS